MLRTQYVVVTFNIYVHTNRYIGSSQSKIASRHSQHLEMLSPAKIVIMCSLFPFLIQWSATEKAVPDAAESVRA